MVFAISSLLPKSIHLCACQIGDALLYFEEGISDVMAGGRGEGEMIANSQ